jgi:hypothetical protein
LDLGEDNVGRLSDTFNDKLPFVDNKDGGGNGWDMWFLRGSRVDWVVVDVKEECCLKWVLIQKPVVASSVLTNDGFRDSNPCLDL